MYKGEYDSRELWTVGIGTFLLTSMVWFFVMITVLTGNPYDKCKELAENLGGNYVDWFRYRGDIKCEIDFINSENCGLDYCELKDIETKFYIVRD